MHRSFRILFLLLALLPSWALAQAPGIEIKILETDPVEGSTLSSNAPLYVRLQYNSSRPLRFQVMGFLADTKMDKSASFNPAPEYPAGSGEAIAWVAYSEKVEIDKLKIIVSDASWETVDKLSLPLEMHWSGSTLKNQRQLPQWVQTLNAQQQAMVASTAQQPPSGGEMAFWGLLMMLMAWSIPGYIALQICMLVKYEGRWRKLAMLPLIGTIPLLAYTLFALLAGSNLWPLMLLFLGPFAFAYLIIIGWMKRKALK